MKVLIVHYSYCKPLLRRRGGLVVEHLMPEREVMVRTPQPLCSVLKLPKVLVNTQE